ncbi:biotin synthase BioB, partial [Streptomyces sp. SID5998]|nr:biotin synthase BioB [Streptomyces sp. SID5998]
SHDGAGCGSHGGGGVCGSVPATAAEPKTNEPRTDLVAVRRRGAGTDLAPNA